MRPCRTVGRDSGFAEFLLTALSLQSEAHSGSELMIPGEGLCLGLNE